MKFAEHLAAHITPEWRKQYINYEEMKSMLYQGVEQAPAAEPGDARASQRHLAAFDESFFLYCERELAKINTFYSEKLAEATRKFAGLQAELSQAGCAPRRRAPGASAPARTLRCLRRACSEFYLSLVLLQSYQSLNFTGFRKILKKHDKLLEVTAGSKWREDKVEFALFYVNKDIDRLIGETEAAVAQQLESGDRGRAMQRLRVPPLGHQRGPWTTFRMGLCCGIFLTLAGAVAVSVIFSPNADEDWYAALRLFRGPLLLVQFLFLWALNVYGWRSRGVNHVLIFELDPRKNLSEQQLAAIAAALGALWALACLAFLHRERLGLPSAVPPLALYSILAAFLFNPTRTFHYEARFWLIKVLGRITLAPFFYVTFADFWVADQLNSLVPVFLDAQFALCYCISSSPKCSTTYAWLGGCAAMLPSWWRCLQCLRRYRDTREPALHLPNAAKYACSCLVILLASLCTACRDWPGNWSVCGWVWSWGTVALLVALASHVWDVRLDWGLLDAQPEDPPLLRQELVYSSMSFYYFGIVEDLILRLCWAVSMSLTEMGIQHGDLIVTLLAPLEVFRRFMWNFFRLENEHLNNCGKFRAVRDISVAPLEAGDQAAILRLMDLPD